MNNITLMFESSKFNVMRAQIVPHGKYFIVLSHAGYIGMHKSVRVTIWKLEGENIQEVCGSPQTFTDTAENRKSLIHAAEAVIDSWE